MKKKKEPKSKVKTKTKTQKSGGFRFGIRAKIIVMCILIAVIPALLTCVISVNMSMNNSSESTYLRLTDRTHSVSQQVQSYVHEGYAVIEELSYSTDLSGGDPQLQTDLLMQTIDHNENFILIYQQDTNGDQTARTSGTLGNRADRWWFIQEMQTKKAFVSKSYFDMNTNEAVTSIVFPVWEHGSATNMMGVLAADFSLSRLQEIIDDYNTEEMYTIVVDGEGSVIAHRDQTQVAEIYNYINSTKSATVNGSAVESVITLPDGLKELTQKALNGQTGTAELKNMQGEDAIYSYAPVSIPGDSDNWAVITVALKSAIYADTYRLASAISLLCLLMVVAVVLIAVFFARALTKPLQKLSAAADQIAQGNLDVTLNVNKNDEIGDVSKALNGTIDRLKQYIDYIREISEVLEQISHGNLAFDLHYDYAGEFQSIKEGLTNIRHTLSQTISEIKVIAEDVNKESLALSNVSQTLAQGTTEQAASVEQLSASIAQVLDHVKVNAGNAMDAERISVDAEDMVNIGNRQMQEMLQAMAEISSSSSEIGKIIKPIDDIAFQTNILALNAAVEAARAGVAGKGFAVVADEVRSLAQKSAEAAQNTTNLIESSIQTVNKGTKIANGTADSLRSIVGGSQQTLKLVREIASASAEQTISIEEITSGINQVSEVIQTTSSTAADSANTSSELSRHASHLKELVDHFKVDDSYGNRF